MEELSLSPYPSLPHDSYRHLQPPCHLQPPHHLEWGRRHSEPHITLSGPLQGLTRRGSEPSYLPSVTAGWGWAGAYQGMEPGLEELFSKAEDIGGSSWKSLSLACESSGVLQVGTSEI